MLKITLLKNKRFAFCVTLTNRDGKRFVNQFKGVRSHYMNKETYPMDFMIYNPTNAEGYQVECMDLGKTKDTFKKAMDLMDGDLKIIY